MTRRPRRAPRLLGALVAALLLLAVPAAAQARRQHLPASFFGTLASDVDAYNAPPAVWDAGFALMHKAGIGAFRQTFDAARPTTTLDAFVLSAARHRIRVVPLVLDARHYKLTPQATHGLYVPKSFGVVTRFAGRLAHRYGPHGTLWRGPNRRYRAYAVRTWQIWNEPNLPVWWRPRPDPRRYVHLVKVMARAIHRYDRRATILSAGIPDSTQSKPRTYKQYLTAFLKDGGYRYVDGIGVHAYAPSVAGMKRVLKTYRRVLDAHHGRRLGMFISEFGWADAGHRNPMVVGRRGQAARIAGAFRLIGRLRRPYRISGAFYYDWRDYQPLPGDPRGDTWGYHTGLLTVSGKRKPAFAAYRRAVARLR